MKGTAYGYVRVSTQLQNEARQLAAMREFGVAEGIAAAKAQGVRFGALCRTLPDNFEELRQAWRSGQITLRTAAEICGIPKSTFRNAAVRAEMAVTCQ